MTSTWEVIEKKVRGRVMAQVSSRIGDRDGAEIFSMRIGTVQMLDNGETRVNVHMSVYDIPDALELMKELSEKYMDLRKAAYVRAANQRESYRYREAKPRGGDR